MQDNMLIEDNNQRTLYDYYDDNNKMNEEKSYLRQQLYHYNYDDENDNDRDVIRNKNEDEDGKDNANVIINQYNIKNQSQASSLQELQQYIQLCEKKIALMDPKQHFPIQESDIEQFNNNTNDNDNGLIQYSEEFQSFLLQHKYESFRHFLIDYSKLTSDLYTQNRLIEEFQLKEKSYKQISEQYDNLLQSANKLKEESLRTSNQLAYYQQENSSLKQELLNDQEMRKHFSQLESAYESTHLSNLKLNQEKEALIDQISSLKGELEVKHSELFNFINDSTSNHYKEIEQIRHNALTNIKSDYEAKYNELNSLLQAKTKKMTIISTKLIQTEQALLEAQSTIHDLKPKYSNISTELTMQKELNSNLNNESLHSINQLSNKVTVLELELSKAKGDLNQLHEENNALIVKYNALTSDYEKLRLHYTLSKDKNNKLEGTYQSKQHICFQYETMNEKLNDELNLLQLNNQSDNKKHKCLIEKLENEIKDQMTQIGKLQIELKHYKEETKLKENSIGELKLQLTNFIKANEAKSNSNSELEAKNSELMEINKRLKQDNVNVIEGMIEKKIIETNTSIDMTNLSKINTKLNNDMLKEQFNNKNIERQLNQIIQTIQREKNTLLSSISDNHLHHDYTQSFLSFLTQSSLSYSNQSIKDLIYLIANCINWTTSELCNLNFKLNQERQIVLALKEDIKSKANNVQCINNKKEEIDQQCNTLIGEYHNQNEENGRLVKEIGILRNEMKEMLDEYNKLQSITRDKDNVIRVMDMKTKLINERVLLYGNTMSLIEEILIQMTSICFSHNTFISNLVRNIIQADFDLMETQRDLTILSIDEVNNNTINREPKGQLLNSLREQETKVKDIYDNILNELKAEHQLKGHI